MRLECDFHVWSQQSLNAICYCKLIFRTKKLVMNWGLDFFPRLLKLTSTDCSVMYGWQFVGMDTLQARGAAFEVWRTTNDVMWTAVATHKVNFIFLVDDNFFCILGFSLVSQIV